MDKNDIIDYLNKEIKEAEEKYNKLELRKSRIDSELEHLDSIIFALKYTLEKALSDFKIDPGKYISKVDSTEHIHMTDHVKVTKTISLPEKKQKGTIADEAYRVLEERGSDLHIQELTKILIGENRINISAKVPVASITSALLRDNRFISLGKGTGKWTIQKNLRKANPSLPLNTHSEKSNNKEDDIISDGTNQS